MIGSKCRAKWEQSANQPDSTDRRLGLARPITTYESVAYRSLAVRALKFPCLTCPVDALNCPASWISTKWKYLSLSGVSHKVFVSLPSCPFEHQLTVRGIAISALFARDQWRPPAPCHFQLAAKPERASRGTEAHPGRSPRYS